MVIKALGFDPEDLPHLFDTNVFEDNHRSMYNNKLGQDVFNNNTRTQLRQI